MIWTILTTYAAISVSFSLVAVAGHQGDRDAKSSLSSSAYEAWSKGLALWAVTICYPPFSNLVVD